MSRPFELHRALRDATAVDVEQPGDRAQQGGLAGAVGAEQGDDLAGGDREADAPEHEDDVVVDDLEVGNRERGVRRVPPPSRPASIPLCQTSQPSADIMAESVRPCRASGRRSRPIGRMDQRGGRTPNVPPSTMALLSGRTSARSSSHPSWPRARHGARASASVRSSIPCRNAAPASVNAPSRVARARERRGAPRRRTTRRRPSSGCSAARPAAPRRTRRGRRARRCRSSPASTRHAMCPSPRNSRSRVIACQRARGGASGQSRAAWAAYSGRPGVRAALGRDAGELGRALATPGPSRSSPTARRSAASAAPRRARDQPLPASWSPRPSGWRGARPRG